MQKHSSIADAILEEEVKGFMQGINAADMAGDEGLSLSMEQLRKIRSLYKLTQEKITKLEHEKRNLENENARLTAKLFSEAIPVVKKATYTRLEQYIYA